MVDRLQSGPLTPMGFYLARRRSAAVPSLVFTYNGASSVISPNNIVKPNGGPLHWEVADASDGAMLGSYDLNDPSLNVSGASTVMITVTSPDNTWDTVEGIAWLNEVGLDIGAWTAAALLSTLWSVRLYGTSLSTNFSAPNPFEQLPALTDLRLANTLVSGLADKLFAMAVAQGSEDGFYNVASVQYSSAAADDYDTLISRGWTITSGGQAS